MSRNIFTCLAYYFKVSNYSIYCFIIPFELLKVKSLYIFLNSRHR